VGQQNAHLERRHAGPLADLQAMQAALVPEVPAQLGDLAVSVAYQPADGLGAGGDFYDVFLSATGKVVTVLGDVSGHGREALAHAALTRKTLRTYLQDELEPRAALAAAAHALEYPTGSRYATVAVGVYDGEQHTLTYALAGHPPPMLIDDASGRLIHEPVLACSSPPIGWDAPTGRRQTRVSLSSGTRACFFTDGLVEARRGGKQLGREQLLQLLSALGPRARAGELLAEVRATADRIPDDMAACLLTPAHSTDELRTRVEELEVDADTLWRARTRAFLRLCSVRPAKVAETIEHARQITAGSDRALLRVVRGPGEAEVTVRSATRRQ
jgi:serine phosphatase RsbU (regulator of sigma subunit)